ncbi:MAG TPA: lysine--tRNA ligase, partial [Candidatus Hydrogenedentes bacterium]|nr:lysine--tRNA ligase [Candidatus Hydrogenedentota bacterium]
MTQEHHSTEQDLYQHRLDKLARIRARGDEPFKYFFERSCTIGEARVAFEKAEAETNKPEDIDVVVTLPGRLTALRKHGKSMFADLRDESGRIQLFFNRKV